MQRDPGLEKFLNKVKAITSGFTYPIRDFEQLATNFGGENASVTWEGKKVNVGQARKIFPDYYFPVESEDDLLMKAVNLELVRPGHDLRLDRAKETTLSAKGQPPGERFEPLQTKAQGGPSIGRGHSK